MVSREVDFDLGVVTFGQVEVSWHPLDTRRITQLQSGRARDRAQRIAGLAAVLAFVHLPQLRNDQPEDSVAFFHCETTARIQLLSIYKKRKKKPI